MCLQTNKSWFGFENKGNTLNVITENERVVNQCRFAGAVSIQADD